MEKGLLIIGAGQYSHIVEEIAVSSGKYEKISFIDDASDRAVGRIDMLETFKGEYSHAIVAIGNPLVRKKLLLRAEEAGFLIPTLIHPMAYVSKSAEIGKGTIIESLGGVNANSKIGDGCIVSMGACINHNACVEGYCHIDCGAVVISNACVLEGTKVCSGDVYNKR